jgi:transforming growth factor-beta-induced protein
MKLLKLSWIFFLALPLFITSCDDDDTTDPEPQSIVEIASDDAQFSDLVTALDRAGLVSTLEGTGPFTVFAPTNAAFAAAGIDVNTIDVNVLTEVLLYHVLGADIASTDLGEGQTYASTAAAAGPNGTQLSVLIEKSGNSVKLNNAVDVTTADVDASNGTIHIINGVLLPLDVVGHASANSNFTELVGALGAASGDLVATLQTDGPFTVFAPLNSAFADIQSTVDGLDADQLSKVLLYHVAAGNVTSDLVTDGMTVTSLNNDITFTANVSDGVVTLTDVSGNVATVVLTDVQGTNGVIHVIDKVIIPNNL